MMISREKEHLYCKICTGNLFFSLNTVCAAGDSPTDNIVIDVVPSVAGGLVLILVLIVIWCQIRIRCRNNDYPPLINGNDGGEEDQIVNEYPGTSEGSELTSGRSSASLTKLPSSGSSCSDITEPKKNPSFNSKVEIKRYTEGIC